MTDRYAVIGNPIAHSRSPQIHALFARQTGEVIEYGRLLAPIDRFAAEVLAFREGGGRGLNVTLPFKLEAFALATERSARAEAAGAANLLAFDGDRVFCDNTDGAGLVRDIEDRLGLRLEGLGVLICGAGGAARGVIQPFLDAGIERVRIVNRSAQRALELARVWADRRVSGGGFDEASSCGESFDLVVNATSTGLAGDRLPLEPRIFPGASLAYDMFYAARPTAFMLQATGCGCPQVSDGLGMLIEQAAESFLVWRGIRPRTREVHEAIRAELSAVQR
jgi:shikimate dehydrogenase